MKYLIQAPQQISIHLRALRKAKGLSQAQLGKLLGISQTRVARIEKDPTSVSVDQLLKVLGALGVQMALVRNAHTTGSNQIKLVPQSKTAYAPTKHLSTANQPNDQDDW